MGPMKQFLQGFPPGGRTASPAWSWRQPSGQPVFARAMAWLEARVSQRMECGDHWLPLLPRWTACGLLDPVAPRPRAANAAVGANYD